ncbi:class I adenylate-forming enzyme family protein [Marinobacter sp. AN1]|uniref:class I adenylate-forming enzyme family protein n=1 Tax=Marinobacter sp. AN1 TaxID=2886046 RepID=UPI00222E574E|nr:AMP-binding protein [Marinobacter sp. AN1]UZD66038.1 AMP-binding protein [Marinobacter sp. AN1]
MSLLVMHYGLELFSRRYPEKKAIQFQSQNLSFRELNSRANKVANYLSSLGLSKGDRVAAFLDNCIQYPEIIYGCSKAGLVIVPINFRLTPAEALALVKHSSSKILFISNRLENTLKDTYQSFEETLKHGIINVDGNSPKSGQYEQLINGQAESNPDLDVSEKDLFCIGYTSGTTGVPKGAKISHRSRALLLLAAAVEYGLTEEDVNLTPGAIYHAAPIIFMLLAVNIGGTSIIMESFDPEEMLRLIEKNKATNAFVAPTMLQFIHQLPEETKNKYQLGSMKCLISAGAPLSTNAKTETANLFGGNVLHEFYGSTEAGWNANLRPRDQIRKPRSCGQAVMGWEIKLLGEDGSEIRNPEEVGEIFVRGDYMFDGYLDNPEATAAAFRDDWFSAGDLGLFDEDGYLYIVGRKKDMIISGGANVYPEEIEDCLHACPGVSDVAVIGIADETWGEIVTAVVQASPGEQLSEDDIAKFCEGRIASYKKPRQVHFIDQIPRNPSGKIMKNELREIYSK